MPVVASAEQLLSMSRELKAWQETARQEKKRADQFKAALFHCVEGWTHGVDVAGPMHRAMRLLKELS